MTSYIGLGVALAAILLAAVLYGLRPARKGPPELKDAAKMLTSRKCPDCGGPVALDLMDNGATAFMNCVHTECGNRVIITDIDQLRD